jgi:hypothetical protein
MRVGRIETLLDEITTVPVRSLAATVNPDEVTPPKGGALDAFHAPARCGER